MHASADASVPGALLLNRYSPFLRAHPSAPSRPRGCSSQPAAPPLQTAIRAARFVCQTPCVSSVERSSTGWSLPVSLDQAPRSGLRGLVALGDATQGYATVREGLAHYPDIATENHQNATGGHREWEAGRLEAYRHALELLDQAEAP